MLHHNKKHPSNLKPSKDKRISFPTSIEVVPNIHLVNTLCHVTGTPPKGC